jgi:uncharacterized membrane protein YkgB
MSTNALSVLGQFFYEPEQGFAAIQKKSMAWLPLILMTIPSAALFYWYFQAVDFSWLIEQMLSTNDKMKPEEREMAAKFMTRNTMMYSTVIGTLIMPLIVTLITAVYFTIASKVLGSDIKFSKWFSFSAWISVPALLGLPLMAFQIMNGGERLMMDELNMLSLNFLIAHVPHTHAWAGWLSTVSIPALWTVFLSYVGLRAWTGRSALSCALVASIPFVLIFGTWALKLLFAH